MSLVLVDRTNTDINMKFLVLALCVCAASAASFGYKPWQPAQQGAQAVATAIINAPLAAAKAIYEPVKSVVYEPVKSAVYEPAVKSVAYAGKEASAAVLRSESAVSADGFLFNYETANGIAAQSSGALKKVDNSEVLAIQGQYKYTAPDGTLVQFSYVADENGYQPQSNVLPVAPAIPEAILRSLDYNRAHPQKDADKY